MKTKKVKNKDLIKNLGKYVKVYFKNGMLFLKINDGFKLNKFQRAFCRLLVMDEAGNPRINEVVFEDERVKEFEPSPRVIHAGYLNELSKIEWMGQSQIDLKSQLVILKQFANKLGFYDASDFINRK